MTTVSAPELQERLQLLYIERALAEAEGLGSNRAYMADLEQDIARSRIAYAGAAVTEIATLRGELWGRRQG